MKRLKWFAFASGLFLATLALNSGCSFERSKQSLKLRLSGPAFPAGFQCVGVMVTDEGIPSADKTANDANWEPIANGKVCPYPGLSTTLQPAVANSELHFELQVPSGKNRTVQVIGLATTAATCPTQTISELILANRNGTLPAAVTGFYELGRAYASTLKPQVIEVTKSYDAAKAINLTSCDQTAGGGGNSGLTVGFTEITLFKGDQITFKPTGGSGSYQFSINPPVGSISLAGKYTAPVATGATTLTVLDTVKGSSISVPIEIADPFAVYPGHYWYSAQTWSTTKVDGNVIVNGDLWQNRIPPTTYLSFAATVASTNYYESQGPRGMPVIRMPAGGQFYASSAGTMSGGVALFVVARRTSGGNTVVFCTSDSSTCSTGSQYLITRFLSGTNSAQFEVKGPSSSYNLPSSAAGTTTTADWELIRAEQRTTVPVTAQAGYANPTPMTNPSHANIAFSTGYYVVLGGDSIGSGSTADLEIAEIIAFDSSNYDFDATYTLFKKKYGFK